MIKDRIDSFFKRMLVMKMKKIASTLSKLEKLHDNIKIEENKK